MVKKYDKQGAEAKILFKDGEVIKKRVKKGYRNEILDKNIRDERTREESRLMKKARKAGVRVPEIFEETGNTLRMEFVKGEIFREVFEDRSDLWEKLGEDIARLHSQNIIHGDLTTSNMIVEEDDICFIDFGLSFSSERLEDKATDIRLLKQVLEATHHKVSEEAFDKIMEGYSSIENREKLEKRLEEMKGRTRYN